MSRMPRSSLSVPDIRSVPVFIYAITDAEGVVHYVGKSDKPNTRFEWHISNGSLGMRKWVAGLGYLPSLRILCEVQPGLDASILEKAFVAAYFKVNPGLLNTHGTGRRAFVKTRAA